MEEYLFSLFQSFGNYVRECVNSVQWWVILVALVVIWFLSLISTKFIRNDTSVTREFKILSTVIIVCAFVELILLSWFSYNWVMTSIYQTDNEKLVHLLSILLCIVIRIVCFTSLSTGFARENKLKNVNTPLTRKDDEDKIKVAKHKYTKLKLWMLLPLLGLLMLLLPNNNKNIVSFLLDNSSSMEDNLHNGKDILFNSIDNMDENTDIILSWFTEHNPKQDFQSIISENNYERLDGFHRFFADKELAKDALDNIELTGGTPLIETIWSNFLFTREQTESQEYAKRIFVIVTDGLAVYVEDDDIREFFCAIPEFDEFYQDDINLINLDDQSHNAFFSKATDCEYPIYEGMDMESYTVSINQILEDVSKDRYYPVWLIIFPVLGLIIILFINAKKN